MTDPNAPIELLITAADNHAEDACDPDHAVGDLQGMLRAAWEMMTHSQRIDLINHVATAGVIESGSRDLFDSNGLEQLVRDSVDGTPRVR